MATKPWSVSKQKPYTAAKLAGLLQQSMEQTRAYQSRQNAIVIELGEIQSSLKTGDIEGAEGEITVLLGRNLKEAKEIVYNRAFALRIAVQALSRHDKSRDLEEALKQIKQLAPEAFEEEVKAGASS